jgi:thiol:disulfide interchange protein DsbC
MKKVLKERDDVVFFIKMLPVRELHPKAYEKSKAIVCAESNEERIGLLEAAYEKKPIPEPSCETSAIDENIALARSIGVTGTPAVIFEDGKMVPGAMRAEDIVRTIDGLSK